jgi:hypothetical protein
MLAQSDWWQELDEAIVSCVVENGPTTPAEIGRTLGMSTDAITSLLGRLAQERKIAIVAVAPPAAASTSAGVRPAEVGR